MAFKVRPVNCHVDRPATEWPAAEDALACRTKDNARQEREPDSLKTQQAIQLPMRI